MAANRVLLMAAVCREVWFASVGRHGDPKEPNLVVVPRTQSVVYKQCTVCNYDTLSAACSSARVRRGSETRYNKGFVEVGLWWLWLSVFAV